MSDDQQPQLHNCNIPFCKFPLHECLGFCLSDEAELRMDVIGQNGNTGEHYPHYSHCIERKERDEHDATRRPQSRFAAGFIADSNYHTTQTMAQMENAQNAMTTQVGGNHYKDMAIQPAEYIHKNGIGFIEGAVIKYVSRWRKKNGLEDLRKARHMLDLLIEMETH